ncbi:MAG: tripartite tricarboxylate transporter substrate binding protein [Pigmentiphaga sp.]|nr:tripartite tricarboxylate transporter substrate binding protein [Pigmentiphaga sp.]
MLKKIIAALGLAVLASTAAAQSAYPERPIRFVVPYPPGGFTDILARTISPKMSETLGQPLVVENRGGGGSTIGTDIVAKAAPDGYTILLVAPDVAINESLLDKLPYSATEDFRAVGLAAYSPLVMVAHPNLGVDTVQELVALAKEKPVELNYASGGNGTGAHLSTELFKTQLDLDILHIPFKGNGPALNALLSGEVPIMLQQVAVAAPHIQAGKIKALAMPGKDRSAILPDVPTLSETVLPGFDSRPWFGVLAPEATPDAVVERLNQALTQALSDPQVKQQLAQRGAEASPSSPAEFDAFIAAEIPRWAEVVEASGAKVD